MIEVTFEGALEEVLAEDAEIIEALSLDTASAPTSSVTGTDP